MDGPDLTKSYKKMCENNCAKTIVKSSVGCLKCGCGKYCSRECLEKHENHKKYCASICALEDLEFPVVLQQVSAFCITSNGKNDVLEITPFSNTEKIKPELHRVKEFTASFNSDNRIPNHGFDSVDAALNLLNIENSTLEISAFRRILSVAETTKELRKFFKKYEEFYVYLQAFSEKVSYTSLISDEIQKVINRYGEIKDDASDELAAIRKRLNVVKGQINSSFQRALSRYAQSDYLDERITNSFY